MVSKELHYSVATPRVRAHRLVLAACSPLLARLLVQEGEGGEATLLLPSLPGWAIQLVVSSLYGDTTVDTWAPGGLTDQQGHLQKTKSAHFGCLQLSRPLFEYQAARGCGLFYINDAEYFSSSGNKMVLSSLSHLTEAHVLGAHIVH